MAADDVPASPPSIHEAERASGPSGAVIHGREISLPEAVARRMAGEDVVVRGDDIDANRRLAGQIEAAIGACIRMAPHRRTAGHKALPHFQQADPTHPGHTFYETGTGKSPRRKA